MGLLDGPMRSVASTLIGTLGTQPAAFTRVTRVYDALADSEAETTDTAQIAMTPPAPFKREFVDGTTVLATDLESIVAAKDVDDSSFTLDPDAHTTMTVAFGGKTYKIVSVTRVYSGDQVAAYRVQLRR